MDEDTLNEEVLETQDEVTGAEEQESPPTFTKEQFDQAVQEAAEKAAQDTELRILRDRPEPKPEVKADDIAARIHRAVYEDSDSGGAQLAEIIQQEVARGVAAAVPQAVEATTAKYEVEAAPKRFGLNETETKAYYDQFNGIDPRKVPTLVKNGFHETLAKATAYDRLVGKQPVKTERPNGENTTTRTALQAEVDELNKINREAGINVIFAVEDLR